MSEFKEMLLKDIEETLFNIEEFAEEHVVDGKTMNVIIDNMEITERSKKQVSGGRIEGIYSKQILVYAKKKEFGNLPAIGRSLKLDMGTYRVVDAVDEGGVYSITLGAIRS